MPKEIVKNAVENGLKGHIKTIETVLNQTPDCSFMTKAFLGHIIETGEVFPSDNIPGPMNTIRSIRYLYNGASEDDKATLRTVFQSVHDALSPLEGEELDKDNTLFLRNIKRDVDDTLNLE